MTAKAMFLELLKVLRRLPYLLQVVLMCGRWYATYPFSFGKNPKSTPF